MAIDGAVLPSMVLILGGESVLADRALAEALTLRGDFEKSVLDGASPNNALVILDFPTFGLPIKAIFNRPSSSRCSS